jgi:predicted MPP superfamily phosphohydrolase
LKELPTAFDGFTILHISDLHVDTNEIAMKNLIELLDVVSYDLCVLTGDYRGESFGPFEAALDGIAAVRAHLKQPIYGVLGDHDTIQMVPAMEAMGIRLLFSSKKKKTATPKAISTIVSESALRQTSIGNNDSGT